MNQPGPYPPGPYHDPQPQPGPYGPPPGPPPAGHVPPQMTMPQNHRPPKKKRTGLKIAAGIAGGFVALAALGSLTGGGETSGAAPATSAAGQPSAASSASADAEPANAENAKPSAVPQAKPRSYRGRGAKVIRLRAADRREPRLATFSHTGSSNFIVTALDSDGGQADLLVNEIGIYNGTVLVNVDDGASTVALRIQADGPWTLLRPVTDTRTWAGTQADGQGDDVLHLSPEASGLVTARVTHRGKSNFIVTAYTSKGTRELVVNEIGRWRGEVQIPNGTFLMTVKADGQWRMVKS